VGTRPLVNTIEMIYPTASRLLGGLGFTLAPLDGSITCCSDPTRCSTRSHAQNPIGDDGVIDPIRDVHPCPTTTQPTQPNLRRSFCTVIVNIEVADIRIKAGRGIDKVSKGVRSVPRRNAGRTATERSFPLAESNRAGGGGM